MAKNDQQVAQHKEKFLAELGSLRSAGNVLVACEALGYSRATMYNYRNADEAFAKAWDDTVEKGYELRAEEAENALRLAITKNHNITAIIFALKNLKPDKYKEKFDMEHTGKVVSELKPNFLATLTRLGKMANEQSNRKDTNTGRG